MREICTSGSVGGEDGNVLAYPALRRPGRRGFQQNAASAATHHAPRREV
jgi:hypothetical protein